MTLETNTRMPFMKFNWAAHNSRTSRMSNEERGFFDVVRCELWSVVGCRIPLEILKARLRVAFESSEDSMLADFLAFGTLKTDDQGAVFDEVQGGEWAEAIGRASVNSANGRKGGRPPKAPQGGAGDF